MAKLPRTPRYESIHAALVLGDADTIYCLGDLLAIGPGAEDVLGLLHKHQTRIMRSNWDEIFQDPQRYWLA